MRLIEREDLRYIGVEGLAYWATVNEDGSEMEGPFLFCVNNTGAWIGVYRPDVGEVAAHPIDSATVGRDVRWHRASEVWLRGAPIDRARMLRRYLSIENALRKVEHRWSRWDEVYHWSEGSDLLWDGLSVHRNITAREIDGVRSVLWTGNGAWLRQWERKEKERVTE